ncbi:MAG: type II secretion system F family protein [Acidothermaceae bacterium]
MGAFLGLLFGVGAMLAWRSGARRPARRERTEPTLSERLADMLAQAAIESVTPRQLIGSSIGLSLLVFVVLAAISRALPIAVAFGCFAAFAPVSIVRYRQRKRRIELRELWPEAVDNLASAVRAGLSLPEALAQLGVRGPQELRRPFRRFGEDYRANGRFSECLDRLKAGLADPTGDRIVESLRLAREVGGNDLGRLLRTLSGFLREDARTRAELETRQGWAVNGARVAVAAPWLLLAALSLNPQAVRAYNSAGGAIVLTIGGAVSVVAYRLMVRIGRLPVEERVLR